MSMKTPVQRQKDFRDGFVQSWRFPVPGKSIKKWRWLTENGQIPENDLPRTNPDLWQAGISNDDLIKSAA